MFLFLRETFPSKIPPAPFFILENPRDLGRLDEPLSALENLRGIVVIDEVQCRPDLFPVLRVLADLQLERIAVVYPGPRRYPLAERVEAVPLPEVAAGLQSCSLWKEDSGRVEKGCQFCRGSSQGWSVRMVREVRRPWAAAVCRGLASKVSVERCTDAAFQKFLALLKDWFGK